MNGFPRARRFTSDSRRKSPESVRRSARKFHHLGPFLSFNADEFSKFDRRTCNQRGTKLSEPRLALGIGQDRVDLFIEPVDDLERSALRCVNPVPGARFVAWQKIANRRQLRHKL